MRRKTFLAIISILLSVYCYAQSKPCYSIGDSLPNLEFSIKNSVKIKLSEFGEKLIILDFWSTWCATCIHKFPLLDSLQSIYQDSLQIILVNSKKTKDTQEKINYLFSKRKRGDGQPYNFMLAIDDIVATTAFKHVALPHYVWIKNLKVVAITSSEFVTWKTVHLAIYQRDFNLPEKNDVERYGLQKK